MKATGLGRQPDFVQRLLLVDHNLAVVGKGQRHHAADPLVIHVRIGFVVDAVAARLYRLEQRFRTVHVFRVSHYNFTMLIAKQILVSALVLGACVASLAGCGQTGALYLPTRPGPKAVTQPLTTITPSMPNPATPSSGSRPA